MSATTWQDVLASLEGELDAAEAMLRKGEPKVTPHFVAPEGLGPLPPALADRATHLVRRIGLLATFVQYQLVATEGDLRHAERGPAQGRGIALFLDAAF